MRGQVWLAATVLVGVLVVPAGALNETTTDANALPQGTIPNEVVVGFRDGIPSGFSAWLESRGYELLMTEPVTGWVSFRTPDAAAADDAIVELLADPKVEWAERDGHVETLLVPNDPFYGSQWGFPVIAAEAAWDVQPGSHDVSVAILDTGTEGSHPDLAANICGPHASFVPAEPDPLIDGHFHGTHVAGTVSAVTDNGRGVAGTSQSCLQAVKVLNSWGSGQWTWVAAGIVWAADNGADIMSMSLGGGNPGQVMQEAVTYAYGAQGTLIIAAAGNSYCSGGDSVSWPAKYPAVMAVASLASATSTSGFSSCGPAVEIAAPGSSVLSTWRLGGYGYASGTSMATPHVSGVAALVKSQHPELSASMVRCVLALTADDILASGVDHQTGWGRLNAERAVNLDIDPLALANAAGNPTATYACTPEAVNALLSPLF